VFCCFVLWRLLSHSHISHNQPTNRILHVQFLPNISSLTPIQPFLKTHNYSFNHFSPFSTFFTLAPTLLQFASRYYFYFYNNPSLLLGKRVHFPIFSEPLLLWFCLFLFSGFFNMEIDRAIRECDDRRLQTKYKNATYVVQRALTLYS